MVVNQTSPVVPVVNYLPMQEWVPSLDQDDPLEKEMAPHTSQYSCLENSMNKRA